MSSDDFEKREPFRQGALDHWCGLYALVNSVQLLVGPYEINSCIDLFDDLQRELIKQRTGRLVSRIEYGVTVKEMRYLLKFVAAEFDLGFRSLTQDVGREPVASLFGYWRALQCYFERANGRNGSTSQAIRGVALIFVDGSLRHWSVVHAIDNSTCWLFDSCGIDQLNRKRMTVSRRRGYRSRIIKGSSTFLIYVRN